MYMKAALCLFLMPILSDCRTLFREFIDSRIRHIYREANMVADSLAKLAREDLFISNDIVTFSLSTKGSARTFVR